ncbi:cyclase family protein [Pseudodesulfovibrio methanolicus]|uniref:Cyclase family protein n=1 Tax=Pseudodesulfovibrio methanolicus TaxID=3126690 RepID=A0ABZ2IY37_9BACT
MLHYVKAQTRCALGLALCLFLVVGGTAMAGDDGALTPEQMARAFGKVVFLSHVNTPDMPIFPGDPEPVLEPAFTVEKDGFYLLSVTMGEHSGTHWGAPAHFNADEKTADKLPATSFVFPAVVIDIRAKVAKNPDYALSLADVQAYEKAHGRIPAHAMVIAFTGWEKRWSNPEAFFNEDKDSVMHYPGIDIAATQWLIDNRALGGLGIDTHGVDPGADESYATNTALLKGDRIHLENLAGLEQLPAKDAWIVVGGVRNLNGSGSPATVLGFLP